MGFQNFFAQDIYGGTAKAQGVCCAYGEAFKRLIELAFVLDEAGSGAATEIEMERVVFAVSFFINEISFVVEDEAAVFVGGGNKRGKSKTIIFFEQFFYIDSGFGRSFCEDDVSAAMGAGIWFDDERKSLRIYCGIFEIWKKFRIFIEVMGNSRDIFCI